MSQDVPKPTIALITGANQGIGRAVATRLCKEHNYTVIIGSRNLAAGEAVAADLQDAGHAATAVQLDLTSDVSIATTVSTITEKFGRLDVLVNNAGILLDSGSLKGVPKLTTRDLYEQTFGTNVIGTACLTDALLPLLRKATSPPGPRVVFVSSVMGSFAAATNRNTPFWARDYTAYDSSKAALNMMSVNYSRILEDVGGIVNAVCPGFVSTSFTNYHSAGTTAEVGAQRIIELATVGEDGPHATFSNANGPIPW